MKAEIEFQPQQPSKRRKFQREWQVDGFDSKKIIIFITISYHLQCKNSENISLCYIMCYYVPGPGVGTVCYPNDLRFPPPNLLVYALSYKLSPKFCEAISSKYHGKVRWPGPGKGEVLPKLGLIEFPNLFVLAD